MFQEVRKGCFGNKWVNGNQVQQCSPQKCLGLILGNNLDFNKHVDDKISKCKNDWNDEKTLPLSFKTKFIKQS